MVDQKLLGLTSPTVIKCGVASLYGDSYSYGQLHNAKEPRFPSFPHLRFTSTLDKRVFSYIRSCFRPQTFFRWEALSSVTLGCVFLLGSVISTRLM